MEAESQEADHLGVREPLASGHQDPRVDFFVQDFDLIGAAGNDIVSVLLSPQNVPRKGRI